MTPHQESKIIFRSLVEFYSGIVYLIGTCAFVIAGLTPLSLWESWTWLTTRSTWLGTLGSTEVSTSLSRSDTKRREQTITSKSRHHKFFSHSLFYAFVLVDIFSQFPWSAEPSDYFYWRETFFLLKVRGRGPWWFNWFWGSRFESGNPILILHHGFQLTGRLRLHAGHWESRNEK